MLLILGFGPFLLAESRHPAPGRLDWLGVGLSVAGLFGVIYAIQTGAHDGFTHSGVLVPAIAGVLALVLFALRQNRIANPLIDLPLLRNRAFAGSLGANLVTILALSALSLAFSQYFQDVRGWPPLSAGLALLPGPLGAMIGGPLCVLVITRIGRAGTTALGLALMAVSMFWFARIGVHTAYLDMAPAVLLNGAGIGLVFGTTNDTMLATAPKERAGGAAAIGETAMELGGGLGVAILGSVLAATFRSGLRLPAGLTPTVAATARQSVGAAMGAGSGLPAPQGPALVATAQQAFTHGLQVTTAIGGVVLVAGAVLALVALRGVPAQIVDIEASTAQADGADVDSDPTAESGVDVPAQLSHHRSLHN